MRPRPTLLRRNRPKSGAKLALGPSRTTMLSSHRTDARSVLRLRRAHGLVSRNLATGHQTQRQEDHKAQHKKPKQNLGHAGRSASDTAKAKSARDQGDYGENQSPLEHPGHSSIARKNAGPSSPTPGMAQVFHRRRARASR